jgi:hypothetical protein
MSELGEIFAAWKEESKRKKLSNAESSRYTLLNSGVKFQDLSDTHLRVGEFDFWPSTGLFIHIKTKKRGRGVFNLIKKIQERT